jgi:hypothetical protein
MKCKFWNAIAFMFAILSAPDEHEDPRWQTIYLGLRARAQ